jgi:hypothetical protein
MKLLSKFSLLLVVLFSSVNSFGQTRESIPLYDNDHFRVTLDCTNYGNQCYGNEPEGRTVRVKFVGIGKNATGLGALPSWETVTLNCRNGTYDVDRKGNFTKPGADTRFAIILQKGCNL